MATELAKAYVQIVPSAKGIHGSITKELSGEADAAGKASGESIGNGLVGKLKGIIAAAGLGAVVKQALDAGGALQQSFGGLDTLYGDASAAAKEYAQKAAEAGISANSYAEQAVSFGAALKSAFEGDTTKAVEAANTAILDMADNSAKMGTDIASIQTAYQGFAKQNYTMLDNLKLGYGGTKSEMERLLADAEKISGVKYDMENLGDVYAAIHVIQEDLGLTGVAAQEASTTFTGSMGAMKAAAENTLAALTTGGDVESALGTLIDSAFTLVRNNALPMIKNLIGAVPGVVSEVLSGAIGALNIMTGGAGGFVDLAVNLITGLAETAMEQLPYLIESTWNILVALGEAIISYPWIDTITELVTNISENLDLASGEILGSDEGIISGVVSSITNGLPEILQQGTEIVLNIINGIGEALPGVLDSATEIVNGIITTLLESLPSIMEQGFQTVMSLVQGILNNLPQIVSSVGTMIGTFLATIVSHLPEILTKGVEIVLKLATGLIQAIPQLLSGVGTLIKKVIEAFTKVDWGSVGKNLIEGIKDGVVKAAEGLWETVKEIAGMALEKVKGFLGIASPSKVFRDQVGQFIPAGIAEGIMDNGDIVSDSVNAVMDGVTGSVRTNVEVSTHANGVDLGTVVALLETYLPGCSEKQIYLDNGTMVGQMMPKINNRMGVQMAYAGRGI